MKCEILEVTVFVASFLNKNFPGFTGGGVQCTQKCVLNIWEKRIKKKSKFNEAHDFEVRPQIAALLTRDLTLKTPAATVRLPGRWLSFPL